VECDVGPPTTSSVGFTIHLHMESTKTNSHGSSIWQTFFLAEKKVSSGPPENFGPPKIGSERKKVCHMEKSRWIHFYPFHMERLRLFLQGSLFRNLVRNTVS